MDRRTLIAVFLCLAVYYGWYAAFGPPPAPPEEEGTISASAEPAPEQAEPTAPVPVAPVPDALPMPEAREVPYSACMATGEWNTDGGVLQDVIIPSHQAPYNVTPAYSWIYGRITGGIEGPWKPYGEEPGPARVLGEHAQALGPGTGDLDVPHVRYEVVEQDGGSVVLRGRDGSIEIETHTRTHETEGGLCVVDVDIQWRNLGDTSFTEPLWVAMHEVFDTEQAGGMFAGYRNVAYPDAMIDGDLEAWTNYTNIPEEPELYPGPVSWFGFHDRYFGLLAVPDAESEGQIWFSQHPVGEDAAFGQHYVVDAELPPGESHTEHFQVYVGTLDRTVLASVDEDLKHVVSYGWFSLFAIPLLAFLKMFYALVGNWGLAIIMLTITAKVIFFPLTQSAFKSSQAMSALQPKMKDLREKFADNPEEMNRKMVELFRDNGVNPLGGCLPMVLQMPVWFALYRVLLNSVELYHTEFLYLKDLSSVDPYGIIPASVVGMMLIQQSFMPTGNMDPAQARMMKLMPLMFGIFFFSFPSGLVVYIFVNTLLSISQQWFIRRTYKLPEAQAAAAEAPAK